MEHIDHILVVDDDRDIRELIVDYLVKSGYHASGAANGKEMRAVLDKQHIDLVVLDVMMPGDDGLTLCRQLRSSKHNRLYRLYRRSPYKKQGSSLCLCTWMAHLLSVLL